MSATTSTPSLVFVDATVPDYEQLLNSVVPGTEVFILDPFENGVAKISEILARYGDITSLHIISPGSEGNLSLGTARLNGETLGYYSDLLRSWGHSLTAEANILLYGGDVAAGETGLSLVQQLSQLIGVDVAVPTDLTERGALDGDLALETAMGEDALLHSTASELDVSPSNLDGWIGDSLVSANPELINPLQSTLRLSQDYLKEFAIEPNFEVKMAQVFGVQPETESVTSLAGSRYQSYRDAWLSNDFSILSDIEIRTAEELGGARGAYSAQTDTIYLSREFLEKNKENIDVLVSVLLEEAGHRLDAQVNVADTAGDEGEYFSAVVRGENLSPQQLAQIQGEDDSATVVIDGQTVQIEEATTTSSNPFYFYTVIAKTGDSGITTIDDQPSINDAGMVAFVGRRGTITDVFAGNGTNFIDVTGPTGVAANTSRQVQINNSNIIVTHDLRISGGNVISGVRLRDANNPGTTLGTNFANVVTTSGSFFDFFDSVFTPPSINNNVSLSNKSDVAFPALRGSTRVLATPSLITFNTTSTGSSYARPMIADTGDIVYQTRFGTESYILISNKSLDKFDEIASPAKGFTTLGSNPGISDDGKFLTFYGDLSTSGATTLNTTPGPGIFAGVKTATGWTVQRLAGIGGNGFLDPGESFVDANSNGKFDTGETDIGPFASFDVNARVGVSSIQGSSINGKPPAGTTAFIGFDTSGRKGIYSTSFVAQPGAFTVSNPVLAVTTGQTIDGLPGTITDLNTYDPVNKLGEIAFSASLSDGSQAVVTATLDTDGDGLLDLWETQGIDINDDGVIDLDLPSLGANPLHKDLFVEVDAMFGLAPFSLGSLLPDVPATLPNGAKFATGTVLDRVISSFLNAPAASVKNPDGTKGITLHIDLSDLNIPRKPWASDPWPEFDAVKAAYFGTGTEKTDVNKLAAKKAVYRYAIFADSYGKSTSSGMAELPGNDFMVTLGDPGWANKYTASERADNQASTFMHELGHTLNLRHGGDDDIRYKPNYYSVMNYTWQIRNSLGPLPTTATPAQQAAYNLYQKFSNSWKLDYSDRAWNSLDEKALNEKDGIGGEPSVYVPVGLAYPSDPNDLKPLNIVNTLGAADFNGNGIIDLSPYVLDINWEDARPNTSGVHDLDELNSYDDWSNIKYLLKGKNFADGVHTTADPEDEITAEEVEKLREGLQKFIEEYKLILPNTPPLPTNDTTTTNEDTPININVLANDTDADGNPLTLSVATNPTNGIATVNNNDTPTDPTDDTITYTPNPNFNGIDTFTYQVSDGTDTATATVTVNVNPVNDPPIAVNDAFSGDQNTTINGNVLINDSDLDGDPLTTTLLTDVSKGSLVFNNNGSFTYTPNSGFSGSDTFEYTLSDGKGGSDIGTVNLTVNPITTPPNEIKGTSERDVLSGTAKDDLITGFAGQDYLTGKGGNDQFIYTNMRDAGDIITDFKVSEDKIVLTELFTSLGLGSLDPATALSNGNIQLLARLSDTIVSIDPDGKLGSARPAPLLLVQGLDPTAMNSANNFMI